MKESKVMLTKIAIKNAWSALLNGKNEEAESFYGAAMDFYQELVFQGANLRRELRELDAALWEAYNAEHEYEPSEWELTIRFYVNSGRE